MLTRSKTLRTSLLLCLLLAGMAMNSRAASVFISYFPPEPAEGTAFDVTFSLAPAPDESIIGYQFDILFAEWLTPQSVTETGYFADNGLFFFDGIPGTGALGGVSNVLAGLVVPGYTDLFRIHFLAGTRSDTAGTDPAIRLGSDSFLLGESQDVPLDAVNYLPSPEPSTLVLGGASLLAIFGVRARRS